MLLTVLPALIPSMEAAAASRLQDTGDKTVIVIDPGHGGKNRGTLENGHEEKYMTMTTALAMYEELQKYDDIEVYLTRTGDKDLTLKERAEFAASVEADFLFSLHFNASESHELYGSEVWVSTVSPYNGYGFQFGYEFLSDMRDRGLLIRGVKTRPGDDGDYYGIIRESVALELPALIIEHCHVDEDHDTGYCDSDEALRALGITDATAVAKYFGLHSSRLGVDYSDYQLSEADSSSLNAVTRYDTTDPDICQIELNSADYENGILTLNVMAADYDSPLLYYSYSLDGGQTYSAREPWPGSDTLTGTYPDTITLKLNIPKGTIPQVILRAYNPFDLYTESNLLTGLQVFTCETSKETAPLSEASPFAVQTPAPEETVSAEIPEPEVPESISVTPVLSADVEEGEKEVSFFSFLKICLAFVIVLFLIVLISQSISYYQRKKRRRQRRNDAGDNRYQPK